MTGFPNYFNLTSQTSATLLAGNIDTIVAYNCSQQATRFPCGLLLPECRENEGLVFPKRETCKEFFDGCREKLEKTEHEYEIIDCDKHFSENPKPICPAQPKGPLATEEAVTVSTTDSERGQCVNVGNL